MCSTLQADQAALVVPPIDVNTVLTLTLAAMAGEIDAFPAVLCRRANDTLKFFPGLGRGHLEFGIGRHGRIIGGYRRALKERDQVC